MVALATSNHFIAQQIHTMILLACFLTQMMTLFGTYLARAPMESLHSPH
jgi:hypothetical protein